MPSTNVDHPISGPAGSHDCLSLETLYRYLAQEVGAEEKKAVLQHLNGCPTCLQEMVSLVHNSLSPATETEAERLARLPRCSPEELVALILPSEAPRPAEVAAEKPSPLGFVRDVWGKVREAVAGRSRPAVGWRPAVALGVLILLAIGVGRPLYNEWRSASLTREASAFLTQTYALTSREAPRPTGGFDYSEFTRTRSEEPPSAEDAALSSLQKALRFDPDNSRALHLLGTYYLIARNDLDKARELFLRALAYDSTDAAIHNDLGVIAMHQGDVEEALHRFVRAAAHDPSEVEAQYNLALAYERLGKTEEARRAWQKYLELDSVSQWAQIARIHLKSLP